MHSQEIDPPGSNHGGTTSLNLGSKNLQ
jgi:hypothetical protein